MEFEETVVRIPTDDVNESNSVYQEVKGCLEESLPIKAILGAGSRARRTQALKLKDIDMIVVMDDPDGQLRASADGAMEVLREPVKELDLVRRTLKRVRAVKAFLQEYEFTVDLVAGLEEPSTDQLWIPRRLPEEGFDDWTLANPRGQTRAAAEKDVECDGKYVPVVRLMKYWNIISGKPLRSYHAEAMVWHAITEKCDYPDGVLRFFEFAYDALAPHNRVTDPGNPFAYVDDRVEEDEREAARNKIASARDLSREAIATEDDLEALQIWGKVFGSAFPTTESLGELGSALASDRARATGTGIGIDSGRRIIPSRPWRRER